MARIRTIKPEFFRHEGLQDLEAKNPGAYVMLVFVGLWTVCDRAGRFEYRPRQLKLDILPFLDFSMENTLLVLERGEFLVRYTVDARSYGLIPTFEKHQRFTGKEAQDPPRYPTPTDGSIREFPIDSLGSSGEAIGIPGKGKGKDYGLKEKEGSKSPEGDPSPTPGKPSRKPRNPITASESLEEILQGGKGTTTWEAYWKLVSTFGGQSKNPAPKTSARLYVGALKAGTTAERIQNRADNLRKATSEEKFMPKLSTWLEGEGYLTPDLPKVSGGTGRAPSHRSAVDQEYLEKLAAMEPHQVGTLAQEEMAEIWREPA